MKEKNNKLKIVIKTLMILQILICFGFIIKNISVVPEYGDTPEYLQLVETMKLDGYRPFIFPVFLKVCIKIAQILNMNYLWVLYPIQNIISLVACFIIIKVLISVLNKKIDKKEQILYSLFLWSTPFNIHFNMSVLCDSLAISFTGIFIATLIYFLKNPKIRYIIMATIVMFITCNIRSEKIYFCVLTLLAVIFTECIIQIIKRKKKISNEKFKNIVIGMMVVLILGTSTSLITKNIFQTETEGREQPTISMMLYERVVSNNLEKYYDQLPEEIKKDISKEEAKQSGEHPNYYKTPYTKLTQMDGNKHRAHQIIKTIFKLDYPNLVMRIFCDYARNILPVYYQIFDNNEEYTLNWTTTRMQADSMLYTDVYILYYMMVFIILNIIIVVKVLYKKYEFSIKNIRYLTPFIFYTLASASFFALFSSMNFHIRYAMPVYMIEIGLVIVSLYNKQTSDE